MQQKIEIKTPALPALKHCLISLLAYRYHRNQEINRRKQRRYNQSPKGKAKRRAWVESNPDKVLLKQQRYNKTEKAKERRHKWLLENPEKRRATMRKYWESGGKEVRKAWERANSEKRLETFRKNNRKTGKSRARLYRQRHPDRVIESDRKARKKNPQKYRQKWNAAQARRYATRPDFRMKVQLRNSINRTVARQYTTKRTQQLLGCTWLYFKTYIENQFQPGMTWANHGVHGWHLDHKRPIDSFDLTDPKQIEACFHHTNYQPLWSIENLRKGHKYSPELAIV